MVYFCCDTCGDSLKKNQVQKHIFKCKTSNFSCLDCQCVFTKFSYKEHIKCISENEKYGGANYVAKENKGEVRQSSWTDQVNMAVVNIKDARLKKLLATVSNHTNIPRKEAKFINFLQNSVKIKEKATCIRAWAAISQEIKKMSQSEEPAVKKQKLAETEIKPEEKPETETEIKPKVKKNTSVSDE